MSLRTYLLKRIVIALVTIWIVVSINFYVFIIYPGDPARGAHREDYGMTDEQIEFIRREYGFYDPWHIKYLKYMKNLLSFGLLPPYFGISIVTHTYVVSEMFWRLPITVALFGLALGGLIVIGILVGVFAASKRGKKIDVLIMGFGLFTYGVPTFFIQLFALMLFVVYLTQTFSISLFPGGGWMSYPRPEGFLLVPDVLWHFALPVLTLVVSSFGSWALYTRNMLLNTLTQDYMLTAQAKGLSERKVLFKHALRSIYPQIATLITLSLPTLVTGSIITEQVFGLQGIGQWFISSLGAGDYPVVESILFIYAVLTIICNLIVDFMYGILDPRIRVGRRR